MSFSYYFSNFIKVFYLNWLIQYNLNIQLIIDECLKLTCYPTELCVQYLVSKCYVLGNEPLFTQCSYFSSIHPFYFSSGTMRCTSNIWCHHQMERFSALLAICMVNFTVTGEFPAQRPVTWSFVVFFDLRLNKQLSKWLWGWCVEMPLCPLWCHCNEALQID